MWVGLRPPREPKVGPTGQKKTKNIDNFWTDLGCFGGDFGTVWEYFRDDIGPRLKNRNFEGPELKTSPSNGLK